MNEPKKASGNCKSSRCKIVTDNPRKNVIASCKNPPEKRKKKNVTRKKTLFLKSKVNIPESNKSEENGTPFHPNNKDAAPSLLLKGSYHQGSERFSEETQGRQCVAMATSQLPSSS